MFLGVQYATIKSANVRARIKPLLTGPLDNVILRQGSEDKALVVSQRNDKLDGHKFG